MDTSSTFLDFPLDQECHKARTNISTEKPPLRVLITEAGSKIAFNLMYKLCVGDIFGHDQRIILHLINHKGSVIQQRAYMLDLEECGSSVLSEMVVSAEPEKLYGKVDIVLSIAGFEELSGHSLCNSFLYQLNKSRVVARNVRQFAKPDTKLVICGPSTKGVVVLLSCLKIFEPDFPSKYLSGVTYLDVTISKNLLGQQFKTTTDRIKNVVIWGGTFPDIFHTTVFKQPQGDMGFEEMDIPAKEALQNEHWLYSKFIPWIYKRILKGNLPKHGMAVAAAAAKHLRVLYTGTDVESEIMSMGIVTTPDQPYGVMENLGFSFPVKVENGEVSVAKGMQFEVTTRILTEKFMKRFQTDTSLITVYNMVKFMKDFEEKTGEPFVWTEHAKLIKKDSYSPQLLSYIISPSLDEHSAPDKSEKSESRKKSIIWDDFSEITVEKRDNLPKINIRKKVKHEPSFSN